MAEDKKNKKIKSKMKDMLAKLLFVFTKFTWFFGLLIASIVLLTLYRFIIQPQYQKILDRQEDLRQLNFEGEIQRLQEHLTSLEHFITLSDAITKEEVANIDRLLSNEPDLLILKIKFEKLMQQYDAIEVTVTFSQPTFFSQNVVIEVQEVAERRRLVDLSNFFDNNANVEENEPTNAGETEILLGEIPIDITVTFATYFLAKDFLRDLEKLVPLVDIRTISLSVEVTVEDDEIEESEEIIEIVDEEPGADDDEEVESISGTTTLTLSGVIQIANIQ